MKVKKIACLLTALVISASAAMVPAVANADAGDTVTVSSTTSYVEGDSTTYDIPAGIAGLWTMETGAANAIDEDDDNNRIKIGGTSTYTAILNLEKDDEGYVNDCKLNFVSKFNNNCYIAFRLKDNSIVRVTDSKYTSDNASSNWDTDIVINKDGTSSITVVASSLTTNSKVSLGYEKNVTHTPTSEDKKITDVIVYVNGGGRTRVASIFAPFTITPLEKVTTDVTAKEAASYTEDGVTDKIGFYGNANVNGTVSKINWYASNGSEWVKGDFDAPEITAENADVTFGLIIEGDNAATTIQSAAYNLD